MTGSDLDPQDGYPDSEFVFRRYLLEGGGIIPQIRPREAASLHIISYASFVNIL
jgi:hypothetical protein